MYEDDIYDVYDANDVLLISVDYKGLKVDADSDLCGMKLNPLKLKTYSTHIFHLGLPYSSTMTLAACTL